MTSHRSRMTRLLRDLTFANWHARVVVVDVLFSMDAISGK